jgi:hypothetical protein
MWPKLVLSGRCRRNHNNADRRSCHSRQPTSYRDCSIQRWACSDRVSISRRHRYSGLQFFDSVDWFAFNIGDLLWRPARSDQHLQQSGSNHRHSDPPHHASNQRKPVIHWFEPQLNCECDRQRYRSDWVDSGSILGVIRLSASGSASLALSALAPGVHTLIASYSGDSDDAPSASSVVS